MIQGSQEWIDYRRDKIGASDVPVILGVSPWSTPYQLWKQKVYAEDQLESYAMKRGKDLEEKALRWAERKLDVCLAPWVKTHENGWAMASLDGINMEKNSAVEIKCPGKRSHQMTKVCKSVPLHYIPQLQHQMWVCDLEEMHYVSFDGQDGVILKVIRSPEFIEDMIQKEEIFLDLMRSKTPPELTKWDKEKIKSDKAWDLLFPSVDL